MLYIIKALLTEAPAGVIPNRALALLHDDADDVFFGIGKVLGIEVVSPAKDPFHKLQTLKTSKSMGL